MGRKISCLFFSTLAATIFQVPAGNAQAQKLTKQDVLIVFCSHDVKSRFDECAAIYPAPAQIKFTFVIDGEGMASLGGTEPAISGFLKACFLNILSDIRFKATGAKFEIDYSMKLTPPAAPDIKESPPGLEPPGLEPLPLEALPQFDNPRLWKKSRKTILAGLILSAIGSAAFFSGLTVAWSDTEWQSGRFRTGMVVSVSFIPLILGSGIISLIGMSMKSIVLRRMGIRFSPAGTVLGWITLASGFVLSICMGPIAITMHSAVADCAGGESCDPGNPTVLFTGIFTVGGVLLLASLVSQAVQFSYLEKKLKGGASGMGSFAPLLSYGYSAQGGAHTLSFIWTY